ncbi:UvrD-helicase domain-containing protein [Priestia flexa]|uniref:UvrD-helicase domain-containing protein n=1 Tax=Priestia flexa TaxID=86664 RepID=UPI001C967388|nr:ATP-dependent helicase [Priestia flexa]MBY6086825.1 ATP-dependent helicase [Priestia flexa]
MKKESWIPKDGVILEKAAQEVVRYEGSAYVLAGPGAGKTELLAQKACYLLETNTSVYPARILAISFKRDAAKNLKERVEKRSGKEFANRFVSLTYDSFAKQMMDRFRLAIPEFYRPSLEYEIVNFNRRDVPNLREEAEEPSDGNGWNNYFDYELFAKTYAVEKLPLSMDKINSIESWYKFQLWKTYINGEKNSRLTFPMISRIVEYLFRSNPKILRAIRATFSHVFLDEFQDTTLIQYDLVKTIFMDSNVSVTAVGDLKQKIMGWAGAMEGVFNRFKEDFNAKEFEMVLNHRSAPNLVRIQTSIINDMMGGSTVITPSDKWKNADEGICEIWNFTYASEEAKTLALEIKTWIDEEKLERRDIGILVRQRADKYCDLLIDELSNLGIHSRIEDQWQDLLAENFMKYIIDVFSLATTARDPKAWASLISNVLSLRGDNETESYQVEKEINSFIVEFKKTLKDESIKVTEKVVEQWLYKILTLIGLDLIKSSYPEYRKGKYLERKLKQTAEFLFYSYEKHRVWNKAIEDFLGIYSIPIMSIHKSKGLEFESVILLGLEDGAFWNFEESPDDETFTFFVAMSRAKNRMIFTFCKNRFNGQERSKIDEIYQMLENADVKQFKWE